jgi:hypothetical protein
MDITDKMLAYRECARGLWNNHLRQHAEPYVDFDAVDVFADICGKLFAEMVLKPAGCTLAEIFARPVHDRLSIMIRRPTEQGVYWDDPVTSLKPEDLRLSFLTFYDFDDFNYRDFRYCLVKLVQCAEHPELVGREALVEPQDVRMESRGVAGGL